MAEFADIALRFGTDGGYRHDLRRSRLSRRNGALSDDVGAPLGGQYQVIAMDEFVAATIPENRCDLSALAAGNPDRIAV